MRKRNFKKRGNVVLTDIAQNIAQRYTLSARAGLNCVCAFMCVRQRGLLFIIGCFSTTLGLKGYPRVSHFPEVIHQSSVLTAYWRTFVQKNHVTVHLFPVVFILSSPDRLGAYFWIRINKIWQNDLQKIWFQRKNDTRFRISQLKKCQKSAFIFLWWHQHVYTDRFVHIEANLCKDQAERGQMSLVKQLLSLVTLLSHKEKHPALWNKFKLK